MTNRVVTIVAMGALAATLAFSGEPKKCTKPTQQCLNEMAAKLKTSGWIGVMLDWGKDDLLIVKEVFAGSPADRAGIQAGDTLFAMNGIALIPANDEKVHKVRQGLKSGSSVTYTIRRNGRSQDLTMTLAPMPADTMAKYIGEHMLEHAVQDMAASKDPKKN